MHRHFMALVPAAVAMRGGSPTEQSDQPHGEEPVQTDSDKWIWIGSPEPVRNSYIQARKTFSLRSKPASALLKVSADSRYELFVNGLYVGKGPVRSPEGYSYFDTHDVAALLKRGKNVVAVQVHHIGRSTYSNSARKPGMICKAEIEVGAETQRWGTDETWKVRRATEWMPDGRQIGNQLGCQEIYDAGSAPEDWTEAKFNEKGWENAVVVGTVPAMPWGDLFEREIPQLREEIILPRSVLNQANSPEVAKDTPAAEMPEIMANAELTPLKAGSVSDADALLADGGLTQIKTPRGDRGVVVVLDFGREVFGNVEVCLTGGSGTIDIGYSEKLIDERVKPNVGDTAYTDRIILKKGRVAWRSFEPRALRYLQIEFRRCSKPIALEYVRVNQTTYPVEQTGSFECSDDLLNAVWKAGVYTTQLCMEDIYIDSPWRERAQWWADARVASRTAYYAFNDTKLLAQGLRQIASSQGKDGSILGLYPAGEEMLAPDYALLWVFSILDYFAFSDDESLVAELYPKVRQLLKWFAKYEGESGMLGDVPGRLLVDRADLEREGEVTSLNCFYMHALRVASALAVISDHPEEAEEYNDAANRLRVAINKFMYVPRKGLYAECRTNGELIEKFSRQTNILAALFDVTDQYQKAGIFRQVSGGPLAEITTPYFASYYLEALYSADHHDKALDYIRRKWGDMIKAGATTLWEDFASEGSQCHGSAVSPVRDLIAEFVGIKPVLGTHRFSVTPHTANLRWARGSVATDFGPLSVDWRFFRNRMDISVDVPEGLRVDVYPPGPVDSTITVDGKRWPTRFVTLGAGRHEVRVAAPKPGKIISTYDETATPLMQHVEILDRGIRVGRGRSVVLEPRKRGRRGAKHAEPIEVRMDAATLGEEPAVVEEELLEVVQPAAEAAEEPTTRKRRRRSRGGRGRGKSTTGAVETGEAPAEQAPVEVTEEVNAEEPQTAQTVSEEAPAPKKRRRRGGRGRGRSRIGLEAEPAALTEETVPQSVEEQPSEAEAAPVEQPEQPAEELPRKRRRRSRGGRGRGRARTEAEAETTAPVEETTDQPVDEESPQATAAEQPEQPAEEAPAKRRRRPRGGRGRGRSRTEAESEQAAPVEDSAAEFAPQPIEEKPSEPEAAAAEAPGEEAPAKPKRRSRGGRGRGRSAKAEASAEVAQEPAAESTAGSLPAPGSSADVLYQAHPISLPQPESSVAEPAAESAAEQPKKKRTYTRRRTSKKAESADEAKHADTGKTDNPADSE